MAVTRKDQKYAVKVVYKPEYDASGLLELGAFTQTFSKVKETASPSELKAFADALMSLTVYAKAPYKLTLIDTSELAIA